jgi:hypothetical protein
VTLVHGVHEVVLEWPHPGCVDLDSIEVDLVGTTANSQLHNKRHCPNWAFYARAKDARTYSPGDSCSRGPVHFLCFSKRLRRPHSASWDYNRLAGFRLCVFLRTGLGKARLLFPSVPAFGGRNCSLASWMTVKPEADGRTQDPRASAPVALRRSGGAGTRNELPLAQSRRLRVFKRSVRACRSSWL